MMKLDLIEIERARDDVRRGMPVVMCSGDDKILVFSAEDSSNTQLQLIDKLGDHSFDVVLTSKRAAYVPLESPYNVITIKMDGQPPHLIDLIHRIIGLIDEQAELEPITHHTKEATKLQTEALTFIKLTELIPAVITLKLDDITDERLSEVFEAPIMTIHAEKVRHYYTKRFATIKRVCKAPLTLKNAPDAAIYGYRPDIGGSEHYAIIVGNPFNDEAPLVRLHSSCYTGDLLASMRCDCG
ncbi:MAG: hypothetical protein MK137_09080, partial [Rickettsiales bacterium]|nr:hypothetical protein [Rickettsiales bacterium]